MTTKEFIEKAIAGGWKKELVLENPTIEIESDWIKLAQFFGAKHATIWRIPIEVIFLDPRAWKAVAKLEGWSEMRLDELQAHGWQQAHKSNYFPEHVWHMHRMIDALAEEKTIEEFLATL